MKTVFAACVVIAAMSAIAHAQSLNLAGTWQGVLRLGSEQHQILKISPAQGGGWNGNLYWPDNAQAADTTIPHPITEISLRGREIQFSIEGAHYRGAISQDGKSMSGELKQGDIALPFNLTRASSSTAWPIDPSKHTVHFVNVDKGVRLEIVDWGGSGPPLIFLPGLGFTAHEFDGLAPDFVSTNHVYAITRRGFGQSSKPAPTDKNYSADRLGDDIIAVMNALKLNRAIVAG
ncbi:MAG TPA: alpha/beta hydrolase, partial [Paralcaligenes sp.]